MEDVALSFNEDDPQLSKNENINIGKDIFVLSLGEFEGPIDLLLDLARKQKVDLKEVSILDLADQYLDFINNAKNLNLELAAEYLVMAAWLAYLKSKLLMPTEDEGELSGEDLSFALSFQLRRLNAMREAGKDLFNLSLLNKDRFVKGNREKEKINLFFQDNTCLNDLLLSYTSILRAKDTSEYSPHYKKLESVELALIRLNKMLSDNKEWEELSMFLPEHLFTKDIIYNRSILASTFSATLELVKSGKLELKQKQPFGKLFIRNNK